MTYFTSWEEFAKAAERLYMNDPVRCRYVIKYRHCDGKLMMKITDNKVAGMPVALTNVAVFRKVYDTLLDKETKMCLQYRTEHAQDIRKVEKLTSQLMRHMASKEK